MSKTKCHNFSLFWENHPGARSIVTGPLQTVRLIAVSVAVNWNMKRDMNTTRNMKTKMNMKYMDLKGDRVPLKSGFAIIWPTRLWSTRPGSTEQMFVSYPSPSLYNMFQVDFAVAQALSSWSEVTSLTFTEIEGEVDINISFDRLFINQVSLISTLFKRSPLWSGPLDRTSISMGFWSNWVWSRILACRPESAWRRSYKQRLLSNLESWHFSCGGTSLS